MDAPAQQEALTRLVELALAEDIGPGDITGEATLSPDARAEAQITQKQPGVLYGFAAVEEVYDQLGGEVQVEWQCAEGEWRTVGSEVARLSGPARALLAGERAALNFLAHLSGVATMTARFVATVDGTGARILDTRKTTPGMRALEKAAVVAGGGVNHRAGLYDAYLIKENHIAVAGGVAAAVAACRRRADSAPPGWQGEQSVTASAGQAGSGALVQVECETLAQLGEAIAAGADRALLDNMAPATLAEAVALRDREVGRPQPPGPDAAGLPGGFLLEASGGVTLENVRTIAESGVDLISTGAITHSAPALDLTLRLA